MKLILGVSIIAMKEEDHESYQAKFFTQSKQVICQARMEESIIIDERLFDKEGYFLAQLTEKPNFNEYLPTILEFIRTQKKIEGSQLIPLAFNLDLYSVNKAKSKLIRELLCNPQSDHCSIGNVIIPNSLSEPALSLFCLFSNRYFSTYFRYIVTRVTNQQDIRALNTYLIDNNNHITEKTIGDPYRCCLIQTQSTNNTKLLAITLMIIKYYDKLVTGPFFMQNWQTYYQGCAIVTGNEAAPDGTTALMFAVGGGYLKLVELLLLLGANPLLQNEYGDDALSIATIQLQRIFLPEHRQTLFKKIEKLLKKHLASRAKTAYATLRCLMKVIPQVPSELISAIALNTVGAHSPKLWNYLE